MHTHYRYTMNSIYYLSALTIFLSACTGTKPLEELPKGRDEVRKEDFGKAFGAEFLVFGKNNDNKFDMAGGGGGMRVNPYLWRATLETLSFMPLASADASGGVVVTDWYVSAANPSERLKVTVYIQDRVLRADAIKVSIHKEVNKGGSWLPGTTDANTARHMEDIILSKARDLKIQNMAK